MSAFSVHDSYIALELLQDRLDLRQLNPRSLPKSSPGMSIPSYDIDTHIHDPPWLAALHQCSKVHCQCNGDIEAILIDTGLGIVLCVSSVFYANRDVLQKTE